mgnify:CR=1 FL=1
MQDASYKLEMLTLRPGSTMQINGHGLGDSFLSVVTGEGSYSEDATPLNRPLSLGAMLAINRNKKVFRSDIRQMPLRAGDMLVFHSIWTDLAQAGGHGRHPRIIAIQQPHLGPPKQAGLGRCSCRRQGQVVRGSS